MLMMILNLVVQQGGQDEDEVADKDKELQGILEEEEKEVEALEEH